ncbi:unnamed protein product [marine sediment metagenome]|uniref:Roc domain-containing protein n=1 Tax=marine sediment metagenome TaxID=412755 RepID=X0XCL9_9ZZZZ
MVEHFKIFKVCLLAGKNVGKKTLEEISQKVPDHETGLTLGVEWFYKDVLVNGNITTKVQLWTNSNNETFQPLWKFYIRGSNGIILMYDITYANSLNVISEWYQRVKNQLDYEVPVLLVGNKLDLEENREVSKEQIKKFKTDNKISSSIEISLKTGENVDAMLRKVIGIIDSV